MNADGTTTNTTASDLADVGTVDYKYEQFENKKIKDKYQEEKKKEKGQYGRSFWKTNRIKVQQPERMVHWINIEDQWKDGWTQDICIVW